MSFSLERLSATRGTFYHSGTSNLPNISYEVVQVLEDATVITVLSGEDAKGNPVDLKNVLGLSAGPSLGKGVLIVVPFGWKITQIQLSSGSVMLS